MPVKRLKEQYPALTEFLLEHFHQDAFMENEEATTMTELIDSVYQSLFVNHVEAEPFHVSELKSQMFNFLNSLVYESYKVKYVEEVILLDLGGLEPMEFIQYLYYRLKLEIRERQIFYEGEGGE